jgi:hypothetical protein
MLILSFVPGLRQVPRPSRASRGRRKVAWRSRPVATLDEFARVPPAAHATDAIGCNGGADAERVSDDRPWPSERRAPAAGRRLDPETGGGAKAMRAIGDDVSAIATDDPTSARRQCLIPLDRRQRLIPRFRRHDKRERYLAADAEVALAGLAEQTPHRPRRLVMANNGRFQ